MITLLFLFLILAISTIAEADCTSPSGVAGQVQWLTADSKVKFCDGTNWIDTSGATGASCAGTTAGTINYSAGDMRYCNGTNWISMGSGVGDGSCAGATAGTFNWSSPNVRFCNGTTWFLASISGPQEAVLTSGTTWSVPATWNNSNNSVECIGGGGGGGGGGRDALPSGKIGANGGLYGGGGGGSAETGTGGQGAAGVCVVKWTP